MWGYRHGWMMNGEGMGFGFLFWLVNLAMIIAGAVWFMRSRSLAGSQRPPERRPQPLGPWKSVTLEERSTAKNTSRRSATSLTEAPATSSAWAPDR
jgi:uncharacterized protein (DUF58 family)